MKGKFKISCSNTYDIDGNLVSSSATIQLTSDLHEYGSPDKIAKPVHMVFKDYSSARRYIRETYGI